MDIVAMLLGAVLFPVAGLGLILWLDHLEQTLPVARTGAAHPVTVPAQRTAQEADQAFSRSSTVSLGGSTKR